MSLPPALPLVGLTCGDPAGIGPEIARAALADRELAQVARIVVLGPPSLRPSTVTRLEADAVRDARTHGWIDTATVGPFELGRVQESAGRAALHALRMGHELALDGSFDALVTGPVSKEALHLAGERVEGQTELLGRWCGAARYEMLAIAGDLRVLLLTRHMPLVTAIAQISTERVLDHLRLLDEGLRDFGFERPRLALAGLNPHAGENGLLGREDDELLAPAVRSARAAGIDVTGPVSPDSVFFQGSRGRYDGVLALYHDQAFIPIKLLSADGGITVILGLPYLRISPVHGTAFDLAGTGRASPANLIAALRQAATWGGLRRAARIGR